MSDYIDEVFGEDGLLAERFPGYVPRSGQIQMARAVHMAMAEGAHLLVEAPCGTGKGVAYGVPAAYHSTRPGAGPVVIATANIALQEQLHKKDLPMLREVLPWSFKHVIVKGWSNYLCIKKLRKGASGAPLAEDRGEIDKISQWAETTETGDVSELSFEPKPRVWSRFSISSDDCPGKDACDYWGSCHAVRARKAARTANVVVTNYHLLFAHLRVVELVGMAVVLPKFRLAVLDEGHKAAEIARDFFGTESSRGSVKWVVEKLDSPKIADDLERAADNFFAALLAYRQSPAYKARLRAPNAVGAPVWEAFVRALADAADDHAGAAREIQGDLSWHDLTTDERRRYKERSRRARRARNLALHVEIAMGLLGDEVHHVEVDDRKDERRAVLCSTPVDVSDRVRQHLFAPWSAEPGVSDDVHVCEADVDVDDKRVERAVALQNMTVARGCSEHEAASALRILGGMLAADEPLAAFLRELGPLPDGFMKEAADRVRQLRARRAPPLVAPPPPPERGSTTVTSATLAARGSFDFVAADLGAQGSRLLLAPSPFDWPRQALLIIPRAETLPDPPDAAFPGVAAERCAEVVHLARGRTLCLFTSNKNLDVAYRRLIKETPYRVLRQGEAPRTKLVEEFRRDVSSVLMGVESFWAGVDVSGEALSCVFIDKLPFPTPDDPVMDALTERYPKDWFQRFSIPKAIIALKQGFGRLIRSQSDRGVVVICDRRLVTKSYGRQFLDSLPPCGRSSDLQDVARFLDAEIGVGGAR